jgi:DinB superfamily
LRSFPRRFTAVLARPDDEDRPDDVLHRRPKSGGLSAIEHAAWVAAGIAQVGKAFAAVMYLDDPAVSLPALDPEPPVGTDVVGVDPDSVVATIRAAAVALAGAIEQAPKDGWNRTGHAADEPVSALDVVRFAVHLGVHHLRLAEQIITEVVHDLG